LFSTAGLLSRDIMTEIISVVNLQYEYYFRQASLPTSEEDSK
jgi:hypothetical protein